MNKLFFLLVVLYFLFISFRYISSKDEIYLYPHGFLMSSFSIDSLGQRNGRFESYFWNGNICELGYYKDGKLDSIYIEYYSSGVFKTLRRYYSGSPVLGEYQFYNDRCETDTFIKKVDSFSSTSCKLYKYIYSVEGEPIFECSFNKSGEIESYEGPRLILDHNFINSNETYSHIIGNSLSGHIGIVNVPKFSIFGTYSVYQGDYLRDIDTLVLYQNEYEYLYTEINFGSYLREIKDDKVLLVFSFEETSTGKKLNDTLSFMFKVFPEGTYLTEQ